MKIIKLKPRLLLNL